MKNTSAIIISVVVVVLLVGAAYMGLANGKTEGSTSSGSGHLEFSRTSYEWGDIPLNQKAVANIEVANTGDQEVSVIGITTSCMCTTAKFAESGMQQLALQPGQKEVLEIVFDPQFHEDQPLGPVTREVYIKTDSADQKEVTVHLNGKVVEPS